MRSSEDNADDEFVFVANKVLTARGYNEDVNYSPSSPCSSARSPRPSHPRLNHLQPIPTHLDLMPSPVSRNLTSVSNTTTSKSKATPLPPELIELLPPHLRENTVPDYTVSSSASASASSPLGKGEEEAVPERPPLPTSYCPGDYSNLEEPTTPTTTPPTISSLSSSSCSPPPPPHSYAYLSDIITSDDALGVLAANGHSSHAVRASSVTSSRPSSRNGSVSSQHSASHTAPAALGLTDSGISSGGSSSSSSNSSRSNSSRSLPREGSRTCLSGRPLHPPSPKFTRNVLTSNASSGSPSSIVACTSSPSSSSSGGPPLTKVSYTAVLASDGERASMYRKLEALTPTPSPLLNNFRANSNPQATTRNELSYSSPVSGGGSDTLDALENRPHTKHVATAHTTINAMGQCKSSVSLSSSSSTPSHTPSSTPTPSHTPTHTPTPARKLMNGGSSTTAGGVAYYQYQQQQQQQQHLRYWDERGIDGGGGRGGGVVGRGVSSSVSSPSHPQVFSSPSSASSSRHTSPIRGAPLASPSLSKHTSGTGVHSSGSGVHVTGTGTRTPSSMGQITEYHQQSRGWKATPPPSPEMRRAWNVVGVPVAHAAPTPTKGLSPAPSPVPVPTSGYTVLASNDPDSIYDNLVVRHPPLAAPTPKSMPMASVPPTITPSVVQHQYQGSSSTTSSRRVVPSPVAFKPPSPNTQRRATSRSPTPTGGAWVGVAPGGGVGVVNPHYVPYYPPSEGGHLGGCWVPVWGSSPQLYQGDGAPVYPAYVYGAPAGGVPPPAGVLFEGRSRSCDRMQSRPSPPPSPRNGRRSASPWRGGSASPVSNANHRHSPSPDPGSGRPPRPRRPPMRKSKTVEVGFLGVGTQPSVAEGGGGGGNYRAGGVPSHQRYYSNTKQQSMRVPNFDVIHEQIRNSSDNVNEVIYENSANYARNTAALTNGGHGLSSPSLVSSSSACYASSENALVGKQGLAEGPKAKGSSLEDRVNRLEGDKDSLQLQVTVLSEQVEAQTEKIQDMESLLEQKKDLLRKTEEQLQKEVMTRSSLETQRLELFSEISNMKLRQAAYERENAELRDKIRRVDQQADHMKAQSVATSVGRSGSGRSITPAAASTPIHSKLHSPDSPQLNQHQTPPPNARRKIEQFGTIPRQRELDMGGASTAGKAKGVMFGKGLHFLPFRVAGKRSTSAPNLAETEMQMIDDLPEGGEYCPTVDGLTQPTSSPRMNALAGHRSPTTQHKTTGIKKIFTRLRRSSSGHLESDLGDGDFRRGGMRATASARLGWTSPNTAFKEPGEAFTSWSMETVEAWLGALGLSQYCAAVRSWSVPGRHLSQATLQQLDRDIGIRHPLHRKKLQLAISARLNGDQLSTPLARLDHAWVLRWLDDVGLPQYKDAFSEARIDGRVLNCLTYDDLAFLRLTNLLHVTSLKRGIQVLREHNFDPSVLKRRSVPDEDQRGRSPSEVALWTNHRVMEWLRTVDLSEFAPNLRGSGVHGALMVYEVRFTSELLASLLSIPCSKTLLRRHLNTHFKELVGISIVQEKRELEGASGYTPLTTSAKVKMPKKSQFSLKRKKTKSDLDFDDLLCPLDEKPPSGAVQEKEKETNGDGRLC